MANSDIHSTFFLGATSHLTNNTIIKITWKTDKPIWTEQWPLTKEKLQVAKKLIDYAKAFDFVDHNKLWKILKEMEYQTWISRYLYAGQEAKIRTGHGTTDTSNRKRSMSRLYIVTLLI